MYNLAKYLLPRSVCTQYVRWLHMCIGVYTGHLHKLAREEEYDFIRTHELMDRYDPNHFWKVTMQREDLAAYKRQIIACAREISAQTRFDLKEYIDDFEREGSFYWLHHLTSRIKDKIMETQLVLPYVKMRCTCTYDTWYINDGRRYEVMISKEDPVSYICFFSNAQFQAVDNRAIFDVRSGLRAKRGPCEDMDVCIENDPTRVRYGPGFRIFGCKMLFLCGEYYCAYHCCDGKLTVNNPFPDNETHVHAPWLRVYARRRIVYRVCEKMISEAIAQGRAVSLKATLSDAQFA